MTAPTKVLLDEDEMPTSWYDLDRYLAGDMVDHDHPAGQDGDALTRLPQMEL